PTLTTARTKLFPTFSPTTPINEFNEIDCTEQFGFFEFPACYRKRGFRFQLSVGFLEHLGLMIQGGFADINFNPTCPNELLTQHDCSTLSTNDVKTYLMCELQEIACELGLDMSDFHESSVEDLKLSLFWRKAFEVNENLEDWPQLLVIPYFTLGASLATAKEKEPLRAFGMPFGNNGHNAIGFTAGINLDFTETIEIGGEIGATHFFENSFANYPTPTSKVQSGIFPFNTNVTIQPGYNWQFSLKMDARHFLDKLSFYFQWVVSEHKNDTIAACHDSAFKPEALERRSGWKIQVINTALNYDVSDNIALGFLWQAPISQRNAFRSTTAMFGLNFTF
ncbi:hypothetical protein KAH94_01430, partial [bacterium]|nr:hypothetical protein [bacterium]